jgi:hypothetical protein
VGLIGEFPGLDDDFVGANSGCNIDGFEHVHLVKRV